MLKKIINNKEREQLETLNKYADMLKQYRKALIESERLEDVATQRYIESHINKMQIPYDILIQLNSFDIIFYVTRSEEFFNRQFLQLTKEQKRGLIDKLITEEVLSKISIEYLGALFSQYANDMTEQQLRDVTVGIMRLAHDNFTVYRVLTSKLYELNQQVLLEDVFAVLEFKYGKKTEKEIRENLTK